MKCHELWTHDITEYVHNCNLLLNLMDFSTQEPTSSAPAASASALLGRSNISNIQTSHSGQSSMSMRRSILMAASMVEDPDDIDRLTAMKAYYSEKLDSAIVSTGLPFTIISDLHTYTTRYNGSSLFFNVYFIYTIHNAHLNVGIY